MAATNSRPHHDAARLGRLSFRAWRRGFREADLVLGPFADREGPALSDRDLTDLETLLMLDDDHRLYAWIIGTDPTPEQFQTPVMEKIRRFMRTHVASEVAKGAG